MMEANDSFLLDSQILATDFAPDERLALSLRATVDDQAEEIKQLDVTISNPEMQLDELRAQGAKVQRSYDLRKGLLAPIRKLPPETLGEVFLHCIPDREIALNGAPLLLMQVCRRWRRVASGTPCLWTKLYLRSFFTLDPCHIIRMWLSNSGTLPISVKIQPDSWLLRWDRRGALRIIVHNFHRFRHFTTSPLTKDLFNELQLIGTPVHAPLLESFKVTSFEEHTALETQISQVDSFIRAPKLIAISLPHTLLMNLVALHPMSLTSVVLKTPLLRKIPPSLQFLTACRNIRSLELDIGWDILPPNIDGQSRILLPFLEMLSIQFLDVNDPCSFLRTIEIPTLRELTIMGQRLFDEVRVPLLPATLNTLLKEGSPLERLYLSGMDIMDHPPFVSMLHGLHGLHDLTLTSCKVDESILEALTPDASLPPHSWMCPSLSALDVSGVHRVDLILALIRNRAPMDLEDVASPTVGYLRRVIVRNSWSGLVALEEIRGRCNGLLEIINW